MLPKLCAPDAVLFDIGDTLLEERRFDLVAGIQAVVRENAGLVASLAQMFQNAVQEAHTNHRELRLADWLVEQLPPGVTRLADASCSAVEDAIWSAVVMLVPREGAGVMLRRLHHDGVPAAAVSNAAFSGRVLGAELDRHGFRDLLRFVLSSADIGWRKPAGTIFQAALSRLGTHASRTWFVGDRVLEDVIGAAAAGLQPIWLCGRAADQSVDPSVVRVCDWAEFLCVYEFARAQARV